MKNKNLIVRCTESEIIKLDEICKIFECNRSDLIRDYIVDLHWMLKCNKINVHKEEP